jgi:hypothetical protein
MREDEMIRGPLTEDEIEALDKISELAEQIYTLAAPLDKHPRHTLSDAAKLIQWVCFDYAKPGDDEALVAIENLRKALAPSTRMDER